MVPTSSVPAFRMAISSDITSVELKAFHAKIADLVDGLDGAELASVTPLSVTDMSNDKGTQTISRGYAEIQLKRPGGSQPLHLDLGSFVANTKKQNRNQSSLTLKTNFASIVFTPTRADGQPFDLANPIDWLRRSLGEWIIACENPDLRIDDPNPFVVEPHPVQSRLSELLNVMAIADGLKPWNGPIEYRALPYVRPMLRKVLSQAPDPQQLTPAAQEIILSEIPSYLQLDAAPNARFTVRPLPFTVFLDQKINVIEAMRQLRQLPSIDGPFFHPACSEGAVA